MAAKKKQSVFKYVVGRPWDESDPTEISIYAYGSEIQSGTIEDARKMLGYVKAMGKIEKEPKSVIDAYGIYVVGMTRIE